MDKRNDVTIRLKAETHAKETAQKQLALAMEVLHDVHDAIGVPVIPATKVSDALAKIDAIGKGEVDAS